MTENTLHKDLVKLGFTKNLAKVYLSLVELGETKAGAIVKNTGMHRHLVYTALEELDDKKLVSRIQKGGVARFTPLSPDHLLSEVRRKEELAESIIEKIKLAQSDNVNQQVIVYDGKEELARAVGHIYDLMKPGETQYILGFSPIWFEVNNPERVKKLAEIQKKKKFNIQALGGYMNTEDIEYGKATGGLTDFRLMQGVVSKDTEINILPDRIFIQMYVEPFSCVEIINETLAQDYKEYFLQLWNQQTQTLTGAEGARTFLEETLDEKDIYWIGGNGALERYHKEVWDWYKEERVARKVFWHDLVDPNMMLSGAGDHTFISTDQYYESKTLPPAVASPHVVCVYGDNVASIVWKEESVITITKDKDIADSYRKNFDYLWNQEVVTYRGWDELETLYFDELLRDIQPGDTEYVLGANLGDSSESQSRAMEFFVRFNSERRKRKGLLKALFFEKDKGHAKEQFIRSGDTLSETVEIQYLQDKYWNPLCIDIFSNKAVILVMGEVPVATVYDNPVVVSGFKKQFESNWVQEVKTYSGWDEVEQLLFSYIGSTTIEYAIGTGYDRPADTKRFADFWLEYNKRRVAVGAERRLMMYEQHRDQIEAEIQQVGNGANDITTLRYLPKEQSSPMQVQIMGDVVMLITWQGEPTATVYHREEIVQSFKSQFDMLWSIAKE